MNITSHYPWPVLGDQDAVSGIFEPIVEVAFDKNTITVRGIFNLDNKTIQELIINGKARFVLKLTCKATHITKCYSFSENKFEILTPANDLRDIVKLEFFVLANDNIGDYLNEATHEDYGGSEAKVFVSYGDVLAEAESYKFDALKRYAGAKSISDILQVVREPKLYSPVVVDPDNEKILVRLSSIDYDKLSIFSKSKTEKINSIIQSCVALPAILVALQYAFEDQERYCRFLWFNVIKDRSEKMNLEWTKENIFEITQEILKNPVSRTLSGLKEIIDSEE